MRQYKFQTINSKGNPETFEKEMQSYEVQTYINWLYNHMQIQKLVSQQG
jgi:hypothetical protein